MMNTGNTFIDKLDENLSDVKENPDAWVKDQITNFLNQLSKKEINNYRISAIKNYKV